MGGVAHQWDKSLWKGFQNCCIVAATQETVMELLPYSLPLCPVIIDSSSSGERQLLFSSVPRPVIIKYVYVKPLDAMEVSIKRNIFLSATKREFKR